MGGNKRAALRSSKVKGGKKSKPTSSNTHRPLASQNDSSSDESDSDNEDIPMSGELKGEDAMSITFEFNDMKEDYAEGMKDTNVRTVTSELLKAVDQLGPGETADTFKQILNNRGSSGGDKKQKQKTMSVSRETTGIFLHTQVSNLPTELVAPLHKNLNDDLTWFNSEASSAGAVCVALSHVLMLTPCARMDLSNSNKKSSNKKDKKDTAACDVTGSTSSLTFGLWEDEIYAQESIASILYQPAHSITRDDQTECLIACIIPVSKLSGCVAAMGSMMGAV